MVKFDAGRVERGVFVQHGGYEKDVFEVLQTCHNRRRTDKASIRLIRADTLILSAYSTPTNLSLG